MSGGTKDLRWVRVRGYNRSFSGNIPANSATPVNVVTETPSNSLITIITHMATYAGDLAAFGPCTWLSPWFPYNSLTDQLGQQGAPLELSDQPELNPGQTFTLAGLNSDGANAHKIGWVIRGEQGYYEEKPRKPRGYYFK